tara:strand:+ start:1227 stop:1526 length:300 start_codon:yes stop_codon:yes gene_type:complete
MNKFNIKVNCYDIFNWVVGSSVFDPIERCIDPTRYETFDTFVYDSKTKTNILQTEEYEKFCAEVTKLKKLSRKMDRNEIERVCKEICEIAPLYVILNHG